MIDFLILMWKPFTACLILTGIHAYLGLHVVERRVIFVDLALAQIAALGATIAFVFGHHLHDPETYWYSLAATFIGASVFALTRSRKEKVPHEAVIGIIYAVSAALAILILSRNAEGDEHIRHILVGNVLLVTTPEIIKMGVLYMLIGFFHWHYRKQFILISTRPEEAQKNMNIKFWDFIFYLIFGIVVTSSVQIAGVLLVFSFLIVPPICAIVLSNRLKDRILIGWLSGIIASIFGISSSYFFDLPTGATIVCSFAILLSVISLFKKLAR